MDISDPPTAGIMPSRRVFFHTLKAGFIRRTKFRTRDDAKRSIFEYVEMYLNRKRARSTRGFLSPFEYEQQAIPLKIPSFVRPELKPR